MGLWDLLHRKQSTGQDIERFVPFVISMEGEVYSDASGNATELELSGGAKEVLAAGRWDVVQGKPRTITNESPTYRTNLEQMQKAVECLDGMGIDVRNDGKGLLVIVYAELDKDGRGKNGKRYRATKSDVGIELAPDS